MTSARQLSELRRTFVMPPHVGESRPRDVTLTAAGRTLAAVGLLLFAGAIVAGPLLYREARRQAETRQAIVRDGVMTAGEVSRLWPRGGSERRVQYRFVVDGRSYTGNLQVSAERRRRLQVGSPIAVRYVPSDPHVNDLGGTPRSGMPIALPFIMPSILAGFGAVSFVLLGRQRRLLADGRLAPAIVTGHEKRHSSHGGSRRHITYDFPLLSGAAASGTSQSSSKPPAIGSVITIVYDPDRPKRNAVFPLSLVRPG